VKLVHPSSVHVIPLPNDHRAELWERGEWC
jgi:hypothetical protein